MGDREELDWLAFRYVAGELDEGDAREFEGRLSSDQDAREAVARAYAIGQCILAVESERPGDSHVATAARRSLPWRKLAAAAVGLAACLLLTLATLRLPRPEDSLLTGEPNDTDQLAVIWSETRQPLDEPPLDDPLWPPDPLDDESDAGPLAMAGLSNGDNWIGVAVFGLGGGIMTNDE